MLCLNPAEFLFDFLDLGEIFTAECGACSCFQKSAVKVINRLNLIVTKNACKVRTVVIEPRKRSRLDDLLFIGGVDLDAAMALKHLS